MNKKYKIITRIIIFKSYIIEEKSFLLKPL